MEGRAAPGHDNIRIVNHKIVISPCSLTLKRFIYLIILRKIMPFMGTIIAYLNTLYVVPPDSDREVG